MGQNAPWPLDGAEVLSGRLVVRPALRVVSANGIAAGTLNSAVFWELIAR